MSRGRPDYCGAILLLALTVASPSAAQSLTVPTTIFIVGSSLDTGTTLYGIRTGRCVESTRGMTWGTRHPDAFLAFSVATMIGTAYLWRWIGREYPRIAWVGLIGHGAARGVVARQNWAACR